MMYFFPGLSEIWVAAAVLVQVWPQEALWRLIDDPARLGAQILAGSSGHRSVVCVWSWNHFCGCGSLKAMVTSAAPIDAATIGVTWGGGTTDVSQGKRPRSDRRFGPRFTGLF